LLGKSDSGAAVVTIGIVVVAGRQSAPDVVLANARLPRPSQAISSRDFADFIFADFI
jgi:hypothetical protein